LRNFVVCEVEEYAIVPVLVCNPEAILIVWIVVGVLDNTAL
jgi:hypothetical protein